MSCSLRGLEQQGARILGSHRVAVHLQGLAGLVGQLRRHRHLHRDEQVAAGAVLADRALARARIVRPPGVPGGSFSVTEGPFSVGTLMSAPRAASAKVTGTVTVRLSPLRPNTGWESTWTTT